MKKSYLLPLLFICCFIQNSEAQLLKRITHKIENTAKETLENRAELKPQEEVDVVIESETSSQESTPQGMSDKEPASSYEFKYKVDMRMITGKDSMNLNYFLPESGNFMCTMVEGLEMPGTNISIIDLDRSAMFIFMDQGGQKTRMAVDMPTDNAIDEVEVEEESEYSVTRSGKTKTILGYTCEEYLIVGPNLTGSAWITKEVDVHFPEGFSKMNSNQQNNQDWVNEVDGFALEITIVDTSEKKPYSTKIICTGITPSDLTITSSEYTKFSY